MVKKHFCSATDTEEAKKPLEILGKRIQIDIKLLVEFGDNLTSN